MKARSLALVLASVICATSSHAQKPRSVQILIASLKDTDPSIRAQAARNLADLGSDAADAAPALIATLSDKDPNVRYEIVRALGYISASSATVKALTAEITDTSREVRLAAVSALEAIGKDARVATSRLLECLDSQDPLLIESAGEALESLQPDGKVAMPVVLRLLQGGTYAQKIAALDVATGVEGGPDVTDNDKSGPRAFNTIVELLSDKAPAVRKKALQALQQIWVPKDAKEQQLKKIESELQDPDEEIRLAAVKVFGHSNNDEFNLKVLPLISDPDEDVRVAAIEAASHAQDERGTPFILDAFSDTSFEVRAAALSALSSASLGKNDICSAAAHAVRDRFGEVRIPAAKLLTSCSWEESHLALVAASTDALPEIRSVALESIAKVGKGNWQPEGIQSEVASDLIDAVFDRLDDPETSVRESASDTLLALAPLPDAYLNQVESHLKDRTIKVRAVAARLVGSYGPIASKAVPQLRELLDDEDMNVRVASAESLGLIGAEDSETIDRLLGKLGQLSSVDESTFRRAIVVSLGRIGASSKLTLDALVEIVGSEESDWDTRLAAMRALLVFGPDAQARLEDLYKRTPPQASPNTQVTMANLRTLYQPDIRRYIDRYEDMGKTSILRVRAADGRDVDLSVGRKNIAIAIGTWCPHSRLLIDFLLNPQIRRLTSSWNISFILFDEKPEIDALRGVAEQQTAADSTQAKGADLSPVPLYDASLLHRLPGRYYFYLDQRGQIGLPSMFDLAKQKFSIPASTIVSDELAIPEWIESKVVY